MRLAPGVCLPDLNDAAKNMESWSEKFFDLREWSLDLWEITQQTENSMLQLVVKGQRYQLVVTVVSLSAKGSGIATVQMLGWVYNFYFIKG